MFTFTKYLVIVIVTLSVLFVSACTERLPTQAPKPLFTSTPAPSTALPYAEDENFRFLISDDVNAIHNFEHVYITISEIGFQRGGESGNWAIFPPDIAEPIDLKPLVGENALEIWSGKLAPGEYSEIFIYVSSVNGILTEDLGSGEANVKLPSEKLHILKPFTISEDTTTSFVYDITVIQAGQSDQYILKPQITQSGEDQEFKEIKQGEGKREKPERLEFKGTIETIDGAVWTVKIEGESRTVDVIVAEIYGEPNEGLHVKIEGIKVKGYIVAEKVEVEELEMKEESAEATLEDKIWVLERFGEPENLIDVLDGTDITIEFVSKEGTAKGSTGCNSYFCDYEVDGNQLSIIGPIIVSSVYCTEPEGIVDQEQQFIKILRHAKTYKVEDEQLYILGGNIFVRDKVLIFELD